MAQNICNTSRRASSSRRQSRLQPTTTPSRPCTGRSRPRTAATSTGYGYEDEIICAVSESRGITPSVGLSFVNLSTSESVLCQFSDTQTFARVCHKIRVFSPSKVLFTTNAEESKLILVLRENLHSDEQNIEMISIERRYWSEGTGLEYLQQLAFPDDLESLRVSVAGNFFAICCFSAILCYVELQMNLRFAPHSLRIKFEPSEGAMMIDLSTIRNLELLQNLQNHKSKDCLFGLLNQTQTQMGSRLLKSNILQPSTDANKICQRFESVEELMNKEDMIPVVRDALKCFGVDTDKALASVVIEPTKAIDSHKETAINNVLMIKSFVDAISLVWQSLIGATSVELQMIRELCDPDNYAEVVELLNYALNQDVHYARNTTDLCNQRVYAIKVCDREAGVNGFLDVGRQTYSETTQDALNLIETLEVEHEMKLQPGFDRDRLYYIKVNASDVEHGNLPEIFINVVRNQKKIECQTLDLVKLNQQIRNSHAEVINMSDQSIQALIDSIRGKIHPLFKISEAIALLDMLCAFAHLAIESEYVKPELTSTFAIKAARHPIREKIQKTEFVSNDVYSDQHNRFHIITGCNMSGKSTYIRSIALATVMAQIGCFAPAEYASFPIFNQLFARVSTDDSIEANVSTFSSEMREMAFILRNIEPNSLVIVDELGRGTSTTDGLCIGIAISEALIESRAHVWFVTHFRDLPRILSERPGVESCHMAVDMTQGDLTSRMKMRMKYTIQDGQEQHKFSGLALAQIVSLPAEVHETATAISKALHARSDARKGSAKTLAVSRRRKLVLKLKETLNQAQESTLGNEELQVLLRQLQEEFAVRMTAIDAEVAAEEAMSHCTPSGTATSLLDTSADVATGGSVVDGVGQGGGHHPASSELSTVPSPALHNPRLVKRSSHDSSCVWLQGDDGDHPIIVNDEFQGD